MLRSVIVVVAVIADCGASVSPINGPTHGAVPWTQAPPRMPQSMSRRAVLVTTAAIATAPPLPALAGFRQGGQIQGLGQFVKRLNDGLLAGDAAQVETALDLLKLPADADAVASAMTPSGNAIGNKPSIDVSSIKVNLATVKLTARVENAIMTDAEYIKLMWLRDVDTGKVICAKEFTSLAEAPEMVLASVPKGIQRVAPCAYSNLHGVWVGDVVSLV